MTSDDDEVPGRLHRRHVDRQAHRFSDTTRAPGPGKATLTERIPFAPPTAAAGRAVCAAVGASQRVASWAPALRASIDSADYLESGRLSFEICSALRGAEIGLADLKRDAPAQATQLADIAAARAQLAGQQGELAS